MAASKVSPVAILLLVLAAALAGTSVTDSWFTGRVTWPPQASGARVEAGLMGVSVFDRGERNTRWDNVPNIDLDMVASGYLGAVGGVIAAGFLLLLGLGELAGRGGPDPRTLRVARVATRVAGAAMLYFLLRSWIDDSPGPLHLDVSWGGFAALAAIVGAMRVLPMVGATHAR
ncbi:MAG: hypothetical protein KBG28_09250 [Kofleriaceae bacterium]|jgi:hypothetical protein|nr:hypothetical protein [Kofleriaceae bacterium]MBP6837931.1 hypothetical protein [Kofleriaceae bacterium]MBP9204136.1 hypothetical protein [Kofleriaceae bacterium]